MAKPKLALIPAAQGDKLYSVLPSSGVGDFDFTRSGGATRINSQGLIETVADGVSRLNYPLIDGVVKGCPSHILEPTATNSINYSEDFSNSVWTRSSSGTGITPIITSNYAISPDGTQNATRVQFDNGSGTALSDFTYLQTVHNNISIASSSIWIKSNDSNNYDIALRGTNFVVCNVTPKWQRFELNNQINEIVLQLILRGTYGTSNNADILIYGAQAENNSFTTSYIPNYGTALGVTRSAETAIAAGDASTFNDSEGVLMLEATFKQLSHNNLITLTNGQVGNIIQLFANTNDKKELRFYLSFGGTNIAPSTIVAINEIEEYNKISIKYKSGSTKVYINGFLKLNITTAFNGASFDRLHLSQYNESLPFVGSIKQLQYFDSALNDSDLETLTSWVSFSDMANGQLYTIE